MTKEEIEGLIDLKVKISVTAAKKELAKIIDDELRGTGQYAGAYRVMRAVNDWAYGY